MSKDNSEPRRRYTGMAMFLHWTVAILVFTNWGIAIFAGDLVPPPTAQWLSSMAWHFTFGLTILLLMIVRAFWRKNHMPPNWVWDIKSWEIKTIKITEPTLYILLFAVPIVGWIGLSAFGAGVNFYGLKIPALPIHVSGETAASITSLHGIMAIALLLVASVHIAGALKHQLFDKDHEIERMVPFGNPPNTVDDGPPADRK